MEKIRIIKVGGAVVEDAASLATLLEQFAQLEGYKALVHGGGRSATRMAQQLGIETQMIGGRRVTNDDMLRIVTMVYGGLVNKQLIAQLQARGVNAIGLTGADMNVMLSHKRPLKTVKMEDGSTQQVDFGWVGDVDEVDGARLANLIQQGITPVMAPLTHDGQGHLLNTNADTIASMTACGLVPHFEVTLLYCFEKPGVLRNPDDDHSVIPHITAITYPQLLAQGIISGGMIPKLDNAFEALKRGVARVIITSSTDIEGAHGTLITLE